MGTARQSRLVVRDDVLPYFKKSESWVGDETPVRGKTGPLRVSRQVERPALCEALIEAGTQVGLERREDINSLPHGGIGYVQMTRRGRFRASTARAFLAPGNEATESACDRQRAGAPRAARRQARDRYRARARRRGRADHRGTRRDPGGRCGRLAASAAAVRNRRARPSGWSRHPGPARVARRRQEFQRPLSRAHELQGAQRPHRQRALEGLGAAARGRAFRPQGRRHPGLQRLAGACLHQGARGIGNARHAARLRAPAASRMASSASSTISRA